MAKLPKIRCETCGNPFQRDTRGGARRHCYTCRPPGGKAKTGPSVTGGELEIIARRELDEYGRADTTAGVVALGIARMLDGREFSGTQYVSLAKELRSAIKEAIAGATPKGDTLDEMAQARRRRIEAAG